MPNIPFDNHGRYLVALIALRGHPNRVYHYSKTAGEEESWAIRDYLTGEIVRSGESTMTASEIENLVDYAEKPAYRSVALIPRGSPHVDLTTGNPATLGKWRRMNS